VSVAFVDLAELRDAPFDAAQLSAGVEPFIDSLVFGVERKRFMRHAVGSTLATLEACRGVTLQERWERVEAERWPRWDAGLDRPYPAHQWTWGPAALVLARAIRPGWLLLPRARLSQWLGWLPAGHPLPDVLGDLQRRVAGVEWSVGAEPQRRAALLGLRLVLAGGYESIREITDEDLKTVPVESALGINLVDAVLCDLGVLGRTPQRGAQRRIAGRAARRLSSSAVRGSRSGFARHTSFTWRPTRSGYRMSTPRRGTSTTRWRTCGRSWTSASRRSRDQPTSAGRTWWRSSRTRSPAPARCSAGALPWSPARTA